MSDDPESRTESPTSHRLSRAHDEGSFLQSQEVGNAFMLVAIAVVVRYLGAPMMDRVLRVSRSFIEHPETIMIDDVSIYNLVGEVVYNICFALSATFCLLLLTIIISNYIQHGFVFKPGFVRFNLNRLNPATGLGRFFKLRVGVEQIKNIIKIIIISGLVYFMFWPKMIILDSMITAGIWKFVHNLANLSNNLILGIVIVMCFLAIADWYYQKYEYMKNLRMTKQEVKDEFRNIEGDPDIKGRQQKIRIDKSKSRMMAKVPKATVVVVNPTHYAVALLYEPPMSAPRVVAKGKGYVALRIRELANKNFVPIVENVVLARMLYSSVRLDAEIKPQHYKAVAEVISYVLRLRRRTFTG